MVDQITKKQSRQLDEILNELNNLKGTAYSIKDISNSYTDETLDYCANLFYILNAYNKLLLMLNSQGVKVNENDYIFVSQKGTVYKTQSINVILKQIFNSKKLQIRTLSRKVCK
jgi:transposase